MKKYRIWLLAASHEHSPYLSFLLVAEALPRHCRRNVASLLPGHCTALHKTASPVGLEPTIFGLEVRRLVH